MPGENRYTFVTQEDALSHAQMIAKAWMDDSYRASLAAQGFEVPPRPNDLADEELETSAYSGDLVGPMVMCPTSGSACNSWTD